MFYVYIYMVKIDKARVVKMDCSWLLLTLGDGTYLVPDKAPELRDFNTTTTWNYCGWLRNPNHQLIAG